MSGATSPREMNGVSANHTVRIVGFTCLYESVLVVFEKSVYLGAISMARRRHDQMAHIRCSSRLPRASARHRTSAGTAPQAGDNGDELNVDGPVEPNQ